MKRSWILLSALLLAGCVNVDYVGRKFAPVPLHKVKVYLSRKDVPADKYLVIGRFTAKAKPRIHPYEIEYKVQQQGAEFGGDAICLTDSYIRPNGAYNTDLEEFGSPVPAKSIVSPKEKELFGKEVRLENATMWSKLRVCHYLLLKERDAVNRALFP